MSESSLSESFTRMRRWHAQPLGSAFAHAEAGVVEAMAPELFGYALLHVGSVGDRAPLDSGQFRHRFVLSLDSSGQQGSALADPAQLPVANEAVAAVALGHVLEFHANPHQVLREVDRVLVPDGHLLISGFNPLSLWGACQALRLQRSGVPWDANFIGMRRLRDWLALLNLEVRDVRAFFFRPPFRSSGNLRRAQFIEAFGGRWWPRWGAGYVMLAQKRTLPLTPIRPRWRARRDLLGARIAGPSTRDTALRAERCP
ncbi:MAG: methyltransferase domain-containing protein [Gammaproteobacteria bacterium]|nr:methyltransferase domain-containing protein [Gammaproteobacteria bacterium]MCP5135802.1 methyltransferase domain-containing protein [Gammaproteobacteria bacterium]